MGEAHAIGDAQEALRRLAGLPGGPELLAAARVRPDLALVGGAVRDLLLGRRPRELDVTVAGGSAELAAALAAPAAGQEPGGPPGAELREPGGPPGAELQVPRIHERFGTASVDAGGARIDIAELRAESYPAPGALPEVRPGTVREDLARRDFTVNAISLALGGSERGRLVAVDGALEDLRAGRLRVLHERSFSDDPTRLLRLVRYAARLSFTVEPHTLELARAALSEGAMATVSGGRIAAELWLFAEEDGGAGFAGLGELGVLEALGLPGRFDAALYERAIAMLPADGRREVLAMALLFDPAGDDAPGARRAAAELMDGLEFTAETRERVLASAFGVQGLARELARSPRHSELRALLAGVPVEGVAIAGALAERRSPGAARAAGLWLGDLRHVRLEVNGDDLLGAGVPEGPEVGVRLACALAMKLDGQLRPGREAELRAALEAEL